MTHMTVGGSRPLPITTRARLLAVDLWQRWQRARTRAKVRRQLADYDDHLLRDMGLTRTGEGDPLSPDRWSRY